MTEESTVNEWDQDELLALLNSEEIKAFLSQTGDAASDLVNETLSSVQAFLQKFAAKLG